MTLVQDRLNESIGLISNLLDASALRHRAIAQNLSNVNTPGYTRLDVSFQDLLRNAIRDGKETDDLPFRMDQDESMAFKSDGNNVELEHELAELSKNKLMYNMAAQFMTGRLKHYKAAISGRAL